MFLNLFTYIKELKMKKHKDYSIKIKVLFATALKMKHLHNKVNLIEL